MRPPAGVPVAERLLYGEAERVARFVIRDALPDLAVTEGRTRTAVVDGGIAGFATLLSAGDTAEIEDLFVGRPPGAR